MTVTERLVREALDGAGYAGMSLERLRSPARATSLFRAREVVALALYRTGTPFISISDAIGRKLDRGALHGMIGREARRQRVDLEEIHRNIRPKNENPITYQPERRARTRRYAAYAKAYYAARKAGAS